MTHDITQEAVERMMAVLRELAQETPRTTQQTRIWNEIRAIVSLLPEPVDPDLVEAREMACAGLNPPMAKSVRVGEYDACPTVLYRIEGIKRGRELALKARAVGEEES